MKRRGIAAVLMGVALAACSSVEKDYSGPETQGGASVNIFPEKYRAEILAYQRSYLNDPTGIRSAAISQPAVRKVMGRDNVWGIGLAMSAATDTQDESFQFQLAYSTPWLSREGWLQVDDVTVRAGLVKALDGYTAIWRKGCIPPDASSWANISAAVTSISVIASHWSSTQLGCSRRPRARTC